MIEKLKLVGMKVLAWAAPLLGLLAYIFLLKNKNRQLQDSLSVQIAKNQLGEVLNEKEWAAKQANSAELDYATVRDEFLRESGQLSTGNPGSGPSASKEGPADQAVRPGNQTGN